MPLETLAEELTDAEAPGKEFREIAACDLPCSAEEFFASVLSTRSPALLDVHRGAGHFDLVKGIWEKLPDSQGLTRVMTFVAPVRHRLVPSRLPYAAAATPPLRAIFKPPLPKRRHHG